MEFRCRKILTQEEINAIFNSSSDEDSVHSNCIDAINSINNNIDNDTSVLCPNEETLDPNSESKDVNNENLNFTWESDVQNVNNREQFLVNQGLVHDLPSSSFAIDFFNLFFTDETCQILLTNTNKHAEFCQSKIQQDKN
jgi:hypothetical protein